MWKILLMLSAVFAAGAAYVGYENMQSLKTEKVLRDRAAKNVDEFKDFQEKADGVLKTMKDELAEVTDENDKLDETMATADAEKTKVEGELAALKTRIDEKKAQVDAAAEQMKEYGDAVELAKQIKTYSENITTANAEIAQLSQQNVSVAAAVKSAEEKITDYRNLELWQKSGKMERLNASVAMVSNDYNFVIINAGNNRGVVSRAKLDVRRGASKIAELRVSVLEPSRSVCNIESIAPGQSIQPGDRVVVSEESKPTEADTAEAVDKANAAAAGTTTTTTPGAPAEDPGTAEPQPEPDPLSDPLADDPFGGGAEPEMEENPAGEGAAPGDADADPFGL